MAFISMIAASVIVLVFIGLIFFMTAFLITALILKIVAKNTKKRGVRITGNVFLVLGILCAVPVAFVVGYMLFDSTFETVTLPDGNEKYVSASKVEKMQKLAIDGSDEAVKELDKLLDSEENLIYYYSDFTMSVLDYGLQDGNADVVKTALKHGAKFDDPKRYTDRMAYANNSIIYYFQGIANRPVTSDDIEITEILFENNVSTDYTKGAKCYSNPLGIAVCAVIYNDEAVTDTEIELIEIIIENGITEDKNLVLFDKYEIYMNNVNENVKKDDNYHKLLEMVGYHE